MEQQTSYPAVFAVEVSRGSALLYAADISETASTEQCLDVFKRTLPSTISFWRRWWLACTCRLVVGTAMISKFCTLDLENQQWPQRVILTSHKSDPLVTASWAGNISPSPLKRLVRPQKLKRHADPQQMRVLVISWHLSAWKLAVLVLVNIFLAGALSVLTGFLAEDVQTAFQAMDALIGVLVLVEATFVHATWDDAAWKRRASRCM